ncbi:hypothetical protein CERSUDRAFT_144572 [Gelatoporia subvermispora B]|uniref:Polynucleotide 5'-hydroxyl-kinase GRC3 n=1 Tax=Ceriporiopsis subvermispora (strain B) TaxID=914234 RepID=M2QI34_CERS8|nr:hypothetical protein CERSUDRAFT_144572 [Gelatoporia subvermispora B]
MLSAVAARKLRLQTKEPASPAAPVQKSPSLSPSPPAPEVTPASRTGTPKRRASDQTPKSRKRKKQQHKPAEETRVRYFEQEDSFHKQEDVIPVEDDEDASAASVSDSDDALDSVDFSRAPGNSYQPLVQAAKSGSRRRAWSPSAPLPDSSEEEDGDNEDEPTPVQLGTHSAHAVSEQATAELTNFQLLVDTNTFHITAEDLLPLRLEAPFNKQRGTLFLLSVSATLALTGTYALTVLRGAVSLGGVTLAASGVTHRVFAPRSAPLPVIVSAQGDDRDLDSTPLPARIRSAVHGGATIVLVQELHTGVEDLGRVCRTFEGVFKPSKWQSAAGSELKLQGAHIVTGPVQDVAPMVVPPSWETAVANCLPSDAGSMEQIHTRRVYLVKGPRNSGKSTFARMLLNNLTTRYRRVAFLECDIGQSEFTPGGMVSLNIVDRPQFGPPFTHPSVPFAAHYIGATSPRASPTLYLESIYALIQTYNIDVQHALLDDDMLGTTGLDDRITDHIPLVVNTMGWTKGLGSDLSKKIEEMLEASDVFEMEPPPSEEIWAAPARTQPGYDSQDGGVTARMLEPIAPSVLSNYYTAADYRALAVLSYFHSVFPHVTPPLVSPTASSWDTTLPLCARLPYEVDWSVAVDRVVLTGAGMEDVVPAEIERVLNGAVIGLVSHELGAFDSPSEDDDSDTSNSAPRIPYTQGAPAPVPSTSRCVGLALVRAVAPLPETALHVLTPVPPALLAGARTLVKGELELPVWGMLDFRTGDAGDVTGLERARLPFLRWGKGEGAGGGKRRVRRNLMRKGQM